MLKMLRIKRAISPVSYSSLSSHAAVSTSRSVTRCPLRTGARVDGPMARYLSSTSSNRIGNEDVNYTNLKGIALFNDPDLNKGTAFPSDERKELNLEGLLPAKAQTLEDQMERAYRQYSGRSTDLGKNSFMISMKQQNTVLYYALLLKHLEEMFGVVYTPTQADAIKEYSHTFRRPTGCFLSVDEPDVVEKRLKEAVTNPEDIRYVVVTDGEAILGIGDEGVNGVLIAVAKGVLLTACGGVDPKTILPVVLDCGTNNKQLLDDELYLGLDKARVQGEPYDKLVTNFVESVQKVFPGAYIHFEDFGKMNAKRLLDIYRPRYPCFNDDIQGTGCVTLAAVLAGLKVSEQNLEDLRVVVFGAGAAGTGIAECIRSELENKLGKSASQVAKEHIWAIDRDGVLLESSVESLSQDQKQYAKPDAEWSDVDPSDLTEIIRKVKPQVLIGISTAAGAFKESAIREMAKHVERPIVLPLSNPSSLVEAQPEDLIKWTEGKVIVATGSPFKPVPWRGKDVVIGECNNSVAFPGIGLGSVLSQASLVTDKMLQAASATLANLSPMLKDRTLPLVPGVSESRFISARVASAVAGQAMKEGLARNDQLPEDNDARIKYITNTMWDPYYRPLKYRE